MFGNFLYKIKFMPRYKKALILIFLDFCAATLSMYLSLILRFDSVWSQDYLTYIIPLTIFLPFLLVISSRITPIYRIVLRTTNLENINSITIFSILITVSFIFIDFLLELQMPRSIPIIFFFIFVILLFIYRLLLIFILNQSYLPNKKSIKQIAIFGAGVSGQQLALSYLKNKDLKPVLFIDDNINFKNTLIFNIPVYTRDKFIRKFKKLNLDEIWIAIPSLDRVDRYDIINFSLETKLKVRSIANYAQLIQGKKLEDQLLEVKPNDFLGRDAVDINTGLYEQSYRNKNILVTGGGGSIGSEIVVQLIKTKPSSIIIIEQSELALYNLENYISSILNKDCECKVIYSLGAICNEDYLKKIISKHQIEIVLHCAAYKHVPILEENITEAFRNNVIGTNIVINCIQNSSVERFIFISTDKAVRPTNIMGATKRLAEQIVKTKSEIDKSINYGIVRFGNVLGSSGSVIPLFQKQINGGGPITITDINMTRYFMAIDEAAKLVLLAGSYAKKSEIFLLDMGEPIKIIDLAKNMIRLSGLKEKKNNIDEGIEIVTTNSRPGEKLYEELLVNENDKKTEHPKVRVAKEEKLSNYHIDQLLINISNAIIDSDYEILFKLLIDNVEGYKKFIKK